MIKLVKIEQLNNGAHYCSIVSRITQIPKGWAVIPDGMETPNLPYGDITVEEIDGVMTVTSWIPGEVPEPIPEPEPEPTVEERVATLEQETEELSEALNMILEGVTE